MVNLFTSFGYFPHDAGNARALSEIVRVLKPGAPFVMDYFNLAATLAALAPSSERTVAGMRLYERRRFDPQRQRLNKTIRVVGQGPARVLRESVRAYTPGELEGLLRRAGLKVEARYGDLFGARFDAAASPRCVFLARKEMTAQDAGVGSADGRR
ncbi:MAG: hypothetical protein ABSE73_11780 [Planctomycetota bacterium]